MLSVVPSCSKGGATVVHEASPGAVLAVCGLEPSAEAPRPPWGPSPQDVFAVVDGRFDNGPALKSSLELPRDCSDSEILVAAYQKWGTDFLDKILGEFALIVWDSRARRLVVAVDRLGVRPLHYSIRPWGILLASDPEQLLASGCVSPTPDDTSVIDYLTWSFSSRGSSFFREIQRVRAGHTHVVTATATRAFDYRSPQVGLTRFSDKQECWREFRRVFFQSVRRRIDSTDGVVLQLSGGVDSTSIACAANALVIAEPSLCRTPVAAGALHPGLACDEGPFIRAVAESIRIPVETWDGTEADARELADVPVAAPGGRHFLTGGTRGDVDLARRIGARVVLSGSGGDQLGSPDGALADAIVEGRWSDSLRFVRDAPQLDASKKLRMVLRTAKAMAPPFLQRLHRPRSSDARHAEWLSAWARASLRAPRPVEATKFKWETHLQQGRWDALTHPRQGWSLTYLAQLALRNGVEVRLPFMDWDLVLFVLGVQPSFWPPPWPGERLHREALAELLPLKIRQRRSKAEFSSALANRVRRQRAFIREIFHSREWIAERYVSQRAAQAALMSFEDDENPSFAKTWAVWAPAALQAWLLVISRYTPRREEVAYA
jgi:asparagine synthase (glutamine-hydrolysing)